MKPYTQVGSVLFTSATEDSGLVILENSRAFLKWGRKRGLVPSLPSRSKNLVVSDENKTSRYPIQIPCPILYFIYFALNI